MIAEHSDFKLEKFSRPSYIQYRRDGWKSWWPFRLFFRQMFSVETPADLDSLSIGKLIELSELNDEGTSLYSICKIILDMDEEQVARARAFDVVRFCGWVMDEVEQINKLFESTNEKPTNEEIKAGIDTLRFGLFGMLDWYAKRMGITDQEIVAQVSWAKIYQCLVMDNKKNKFNKRYQEVINDEYRRENRRNMRR